MPGEDYSRTYKNVVWTKFDIHEFIFSELISFK